MIEPALSIRLKRRVHRDLLIDAAFDLGPERLVVFGPSGSGKSTLLRMIAGLDRADAGRISLDGRILYDDRSHVNLPPRSRRVGLVFQDDRLFPHLSVAANITFGLRRSSKADADKRVETVARLCGVEPLLDRSPADLSGGERQRVGLARGIAPGPAALLCDEPVSALDLPSRFRLIEQLKTIQESERVPMIFVTHSPGEALAFGTRIIAWERGGIVADGAPIDVLAGLPLGGGFENVWPAEVLASSEHESRIRIEGGPELTAPRVEAPIGSRLTARVRADEVLIAIGGAGRLSARNAVEGVVDRVVENGHEARVVVRTAAVEWVASVSASSVSDLQLSRGSPATLVVKARSVQCS